MFRNSFLVMASTLIDDQRIAIVDRIRIDKNIAQISHLESVSKRQIRKIRYNIKLYIFVVIS